jgi:hypothetical protein
MTEEQVANNTTGYGPTAYFAIHLVGSEKPLIGRLDTSVPMPVVDGLLRLQYVSKPEAVSKRIIVDVTAIAAILEL